MTLKDSLKQDYVTAMKAKDVVAKNTISLARAAILKHEKDNLEEIDDAGVISILTKQVKLRQDALADFEKAGRNDLIEAYNAEISILQKYLPRQLTIDEVNELVVSIANENGIGKGKQNMGRLMGLVMPKVKGIANGNDVKDAVTAYLS